MQTNIIIGLKRFRIYQSMIRLLKEKNFSLFIIIIFYYYLFLFLLLLLFFLPCLVLGEFFRSARILARHRRGETLRVFVLGQLGSNSAVPKVEIRREADKQSDWRKFLRL